MFLSPANGTGEVAACLDPQRSLDLPRENCPAPRLLAGNAHAPTQSRPLPQACFNTKNCMLFLFQTQEREKEG